jgi:hypothetical protein
MESRASYVVYEPRFTPRLRILMVAAGISRINQDGWPLPSLHEATQMAELA